MTRPANPYILQVIHSIPNGTARNWKEPYYIQGTAQGTHFPWCGWTIPFTALFMSNSRMVIMQTITQ